MITGKWFLKNIRVKSDLLRYGVTPSDYNKLKSLAKRFVTEKFFLAYNDASPFKNAGGGSLWGELYLLYSAVLVRMGELESDDS